MEVRKGYVEHIVFRNSENGYTVFQLAGEEGELQSGETEYKLLQTMSGFLGRHMEG